MTKKTRWSGTNKKYRSEVMRLLAKKKQSMMTEEEKRIHAIKMSTSRWRKS